MHNPDFLTAYSMYDVGWLVGSWCQCFGSEFSETIRIFMFCWIQIRIQPDAEGTDPIRIQTKIFYDKICKNLQLEYFFLSNTVMYVFLNPYKGRSDSSKQYLHFLLFWGCKFRPARTRIPNPDPLTPKWIRIRNTACCRPDPKDYYSGDVSGSWEPCWWPVRGARAWWEQSSGKEEFAWKAFFFYFFLKFFLLLSKNVLTRLRNRDQGFWQNFIIVWHKILWKGYENLKPV